MLCLVLDHPVMQLNCVAVFVVLSHTAGFLTVISESML